MLTFLRKIRQSLTESESSRKYILYAIGEIVLVVIGILIALQINNWNEWRKDRIVEKDILTGLLQSVTRNKDNLNWGLESWSTTTKAIDIITHAIDTALPYHDSLNNHFNEAHRSRGNNLNMLDFSGYKSLENRGFEILRNDTLRKSIISLFESTFPGLVSTSEQVDFDNSGFHNEYIVRNFITDPSGEYPIDYDKVMKDQFYYSILKRLDFNLYRKTNRVSRALRDVEENLKLLEKELESDN